MHEAPKITDCITLVRYIIHKVTWESFPLTYIGSMPSHLMEIWFLDARLVNIERSQPWDILFLYWNSKRHGKIDMIKHSGIIINSFWDYIHSTSKVSGFCINNIHNTNNIASRHQMLHSKDPRCKNNILGNFKFI